MCERRNGQVCVPNTGGAVAFARAQAAAPGDAAARMGEHEQLVADSVRVDDSGSAHPDDDSVMVFHYSCAVMTPDCPGWSKSL